MILSFKQPEEHTSYNDLIEKKQQTDLDNLRINQWTGIRIIIILPYELISSKNKRLYNLCVDTHSIEETFFVLFCFNDITVVQWQRFYIKNRHMHTQKHQIKKKIDSLLLNIFIAKKCKK